MSRSARGRDPDSGAEPAEQQGEPCDGGREDEIDDGAKRAAGQHGLPRLYIGDADMLSSEVQHLKKKKDNTHSKV